MAAGDGTANRRATSPRAGGKAADAERRLKRLRDVAQVLACGSDPKRLGMILLLAEGEATNTALCESAGLSRPAVSHHLALLRHGRIIDADRRGRYIAYRLTDSGRALARAAATLLP